MPVPNLKRRRSSWGDAAPDDEATTGSANSTARRPKRPDPGVGADAYYRSLYATEPDFKQLGRDDPDFGRVLQNGQLDFTDPKAVMQLTTALLKADFGLRIDLPEDRLCPPVPNRHNYMLWLKALIDTTSYEDAGRRIFGLDIGTGASCIYPLLGCTQRDWYFVGTDVDSKSIEYAKRNVALNNRQKQIKILARTKTDALIPLDDIGVDTLDFVMTNPPFYESQKELDDCAKRKSRPPLSACTGAPVEMVTEGGEVGFTKRILDESLVLRERVQWYTTMLGKLSSLEAVVDMLREHAIENYSVTEFVQGSNTRRWAVGWSFHGMRPTEEVSRGMSELPWKKILPQSVHYKVLIWGDVISSAKLGSGIDHLMSSMDLMCWEWDQEKLCGLGRTRQNVWSRAYRRKKQRAEKSASQMSIDMSQSQTTQNFASQMSTTDDCLAGSDEACALGFQLSVKVGREDLTVLCRWVEGHDRSIMESFHGYLRTQLDIVAKNAKGVQQES